MGTVPSTGGAPVTLLGTAPFGDSPYRRPVQGLSPDGDCPFNRWRSRDAFKGQPPSGTVPKPKARRPLSDAGPRQFVYEPTQSKARVTAFFQSAYSLSRSAGSIWGCHSF